MRRPSSSLFQAQAFTPAETRPHNLLFSFHSSSEETTAMPFHSVLKTLLTFTLITIAFSAFAAEPPAKPKPRVLVTISKETTYITEPLRPDGYPDYVAALNRRMSEGVTPENNFSVLFWKAMGPGSIAKECRERYFQMLGIPAFPEKANYFITSTSHIEHQKAKTKSGSTALEDEESRLLEQLSLAMKRPWSKQEFPLWAEWLESNEKPMTLLVEACQRPRRYEPLISGPDNQGMLIAVFLPCAQLSREGARALAARAMFQIQQGKVDEAWSDLLNCHRLARLTDEGPTLIDGLVALAIDGIALSGDRALLENAKLTAAQIAKMRHDLDKLPRMIAMADRLDLAERLIFLDCTLTVARDGLRGMQDIVGGTMSANVATSTMDSLLKTSVDWDIPLHIGNFWYDRSVAACRRPTREVRLRELTQIGKDLHEMAKSIKDIKALALSLLGNSREAVSRRIGHMLVLLLPASVAAREAEDRATMRFELTKLAFTLAAYRADEGSYPTKLADLVPKYVETLPKDIFNNDAELHYARQGDGYLLYSVGSNGKDDGGKGQDDRKDNEDWDDLTVRVSHVKP
jgi:hypothetical protein